MLDSLADFIASITGRRPAPQGVAKLRRVRGEMETVLVDRPVTARQKPTGKNRGSRRPRVRLKWRDF